MKKVLVISFSCLILISLFCIGISAESVVRDAPPVRITPFDDYPYTFTFTCTFPSISTESGSLTAIGDITFNNSHYNSMEIFYDVHRVVYRVVLYDSNNQYVVFYSGRLGNTIIINSLSSTDLNSVLTLLSSVEGSYSSVSEGVDYAIGFGGQVLDFITSTEGILSLLGLSIGLFLIVPFSIRKIKDFVKGY